MLIRFAVLIFIAGVQLRGSEPSIFVSKRIVDSHNPKINYLYLSVRGEPNATLTSVAGAPTARVSVLSTDSEVGDCKDVAVNLVGHPGGSNAWVELNAKAVSCLLEAYQTPNVYLAPTLLLPSLQYKGSRLLAPQSTAIPNDLILEEDEDKSNVQASKLVFQVTFRPWENGTDAAHWQEVFEDPTTWCVANASAAGNCKAHLIAYRTALACATGVNPGSCWPGVEAHLAGDYATAVGQAAAARVVNDWRPRVNGGTFGCKELPLPMAVAKVTYDDDDRTLTMMFCRSNFQTMQESADDFRVLWFGESLSPPAALSGSPRSVAAANMPRTARFRSAGQRLGRKERPNGIRFSAANPLAPAANELYVEAFFQSTRAAHAPDLAAADYKETTTILPSLSTKQLYGFRIEGSLLQLGDIRPLKDGRKWSIHTIPTISAFVSGGESAEDPNSVSLTFPVEFRRTLADKGCRFTYAAGTAHPNAACASPNLVRSLSFEMPAAIEAAKTGTTKNALFEPRGALVLRPVDFGGGRMVFGLRAGADLGRRLTSATLVGATKPVDNLSSIRRFAVSSSFSIKPASPPLERFSFSVEHKFWQLLTQELHSSPAGFLVQKDNAICAAKLERVTKDGCVIDPGKDGLVNNFAKGSRQWINAQVSFDITDSFALVAAYRRGRLMPLWIYTNQFAMGLAFHLDPKAKPKLPF